MKIIRKIIKVLSIIIIFAAVFHFGNYWLDRIEYEIYRKEHCQEPVTYRLGIFDQKFGISREEFLTDIKEAADIWGRPIDKNLLAYSESGEIIINLIYDYRQDVTDKLKALGIEINDDKAMYDALKLKYETLIWPYNAAKEQLDKIAQKYEIQKSAYEKEVADINSRGGAKPDEFKRLERARANLNSLATEINSKQKYLNDQADKINAVVSAINRLARDLNLNVEKYNSIGAETGKEFAAGNYVELGDIKEINIYQFADRGKLIRVLAHELGHALGLDHVANPNAVMYGLNEAGNEKLAEDDLNILEEICKIRN